MTRSEQLALAGAALAVRDAELDGSLDGERTALFTGSSKEVSDLAKLVGAIVECTDDEGRFDVQRAGERISAFQPLFYVEGLQGASLFYISSAFKLLGANTYFAGTGESGMTAIGRAFRVIRRGEADCAIAGGFDDPVWWWSMSSFDALGILSDRNDLGAAAFRPFDRDATGSVLGEGAAFVLLEDYETARERGARAYAEITGYGCGADAYHLLTPHPGGRGLVTAMRRALQDAGSAPADVSYIAAHGSATRRATAARPARCAPCSARSRRRPRPAASSPLPGTWSAARARSTPSWPRWRSTTAPSRQPSTTSRPSPAANTTGSPAPPVSCRCSKRWLSPAVWRDRTPCSHCDRSEEGA